MENAPGEGGRRVQNEGPEGSWVMGRLLGASGGGKLIDFSFQEGGQERPGASRRACRRAFLRLRFWERGGQQRVKFDAFSNFFWGVVFLDVVALVFCLPRRSPARRRT